jgi:hypothetical protein
VRRPRRAAHVVGQCRRRFSRRPTKRSGISPIIGTRRDKWALENSEAGAAVVATKVGYAARIETEMLLEVVQNTEQVVDFNSTGEVAERLNAPVLKTGRASRPS